MVVTSLARVVIAVAVNHQVPDGLEPFNQQRLAQWNPDVVNDEIADVPVVVMWGADDTASALSAPSISEGDAIGTGIAFERTLNGQVLTFTQVEPDVFEDEQTGTTWDLLGKAIAGPLAGEELVPLVQTNEFWFAWAAFNDGSPVFTG